MGDGLGVAVLLRDLAVLVETQEFGTDPDTVSRAVVLARLAAGQRVVRAVQGDMLTAVERVVAACEADPLFAGDAEEAVSAASDEIAVALGMHRTTARGYADDAVAVRRGLPAVARAADRGGIGRRHVAVIAETFTRLTEPGAPAPEVLARHAGETRRGAFDRHLSAFAASHTPTQTRREAERFVVALEPDAATEREDQALDHRHVSYRPVGDGMGELVALLPLEDLAAIAEVLDRAVGHAQVLGGESRTAGQIRADALSAWAWWALDAGQVTPESWPLARGRCGRPLIRLVVTSGTLAGTAEVPGEVEGFGPLSPRRSRRVAALAGMSRVTLGVDAMGRPLTPVRPAEDGYRPSAALSDAVQLRDRLCRFPGCSQPAVRCDLDHTVPYVRGPTDRLRRGQTRAGNLAVLCRRHHRAKTRGVFRVEQARAVPVARAVEATGVLTFTLLSGRRITTWPDPLPVDPGPEPPPG